MDASQKKQSDQQRPQRLINQLTKIKNPVNLIQVATPETGQVFGHPQPAVLNRGRQMQQINQDLAQQLAISNSSQLAKVQVATPGTGQVFGNQQSDNSEQYRVKGATLSDLRKQRRRIQTNNEEVTASRQFRPSDQNLKQQLIQVGSSGSLIQVASPGAGQVFGHQQSDDSEQQQVKVEYHHGEVNTGRRQLRPSDQNLKQQLTQVGSTGNLIQVASPGAGQVFGHQQSDDSEQQQVKVEYHHGEVVARHQLRPSDQNLEQQLIQVGSSGNLIQVASPGAGQVFGHQQSDDFDENTGRRQLRPSDQNLKQQLTQVGSTGNLIQVASPGAGQVFGHQQSDDSEQQQVKVEYHHKEVVARHQLRPSDQNLKQQLTQVGSSGNLIQVASPGAGQVFGHQQSDDFDENTGRRQLRPSDQNLKQQLIQVGSSGSLIQVASPGAGQVFGHQQSDDSEQQQVKVEYHHGEVVARHQLRPSDQNLEQQLTQFLRLPSPGTGQVVGHQQLDDFDENTGRRQLRPSDQNLKQQLTQVGSSGNLIQVASPGAGQVFGHQQSDDSEQQQVKVEYHHGEVVARHQLRPSDQNLEQQLIQVGSSGNLIQVASPGAGQVFGHQQSDDFDENTGRRQLRPSDQNLKQQLTQVGSTGNLIQVASPGAGQVFVHQQSDDSEQQQVKVEYHHKEVVARHQLRPSDQNLKQQLTQVGSTGNLIQVASPGAGQVFGHQQSDDFDENTGRRQLRPSDQNLKQQLTQVGSTGNLIQVASPGAGQVFGHQQSDDSEQQQVKVEYHHKEVVARHQLRPSDQNLKQQLTQVGSSGNLIQVASPGAGQVFGHQQSDDSEENAELDQHRVSHQNLTQQLAIINSSQLAQVGSSGNLIQVFTPGIAQATIQSQTAATPQNIYYIINGGETEEPQTSASQRSPLFTPNLLKTLLTKSLEGLDILDKAKLGELSESRQNKLVKIIAEYHCNQKSKLTKSDLELYTLALTTLLPNEKENTYFIPRGGDRKNHGGKIANKIGNLKQAAKKDQGKENAHANSLNGISGGESEDEEDICAETKWLLANCVPWTTVLDRWPASFVDRNRYLRSCIQVPKLLKDFPHYQEPCGYQLVDLDFERLFPDKSSGIDRLISICSELRPYIKKKAVDPSKIRLLQLLDSEDNDTKVYSLILILNTILPPITAGRKYKPTILGAQDDSILFAANEAEVRETVESLYAAYTAQGFPKVPKLVFLGTGPENFAGKFFVCCEPLQYEVNSAARAVDILIKLTAVFGFTFSKLSRLVWQFLSCTVYGLERKDTYSAITKVNRFLQTKQDDSMHD
ncbi:hypothetical protein quinque_006040 [Culex quinquefasciatus]